MSWCIYMLKRLSLMYSMPKNYYYCHICVFLVYSTSVLCISNTFVALASVQKVSIKCQSAKCPTRARVNTLSKLKCMCFLGFWDWRIRFCFFVKAIVGFIRRGFQSSQRSWFVIPCWIYFPSFCYWLFVEHLASLSIYWNWTVSVLSFLRFFWVSGLESQHEDPKLHHMVSDQYFFVSVMATSATGYQKILLTKFTSRRILILFLDILIKKILKIMKQLWRRS